MEFRILGPLEVLDDAGASLPLGGGRERAVLALLLLSANQVVSSERLAGDLWGDQLPEGTHALRVYVSRLRKALRQAGADGVLVTRPPGYFVRVETGALDAARFETLLAKGRERAAQGDHSGAAEALREALVLWRGPALADLADAPFARAEAARLDEARWAAVEERVEAELACGRHGELVAELDALTRAHPLRERLWAQRMVALYRSGRQAEALRAYQELRGVLGEQLGLEPSVAVARLEGAILQHDPELDWPPRQPSRSPPAAAAQTAPAAGVVTFLFTDLVDSTGLLDRLGDDAADELRRVHFSLLRQAVAATGGEEVKTLGDGLMVAFSSPLAALACAVAIQRAVVEHNRADPDRVLGVRVGVHAGEPTRDEGEFFGTAVVVAKRLCDRAAGGQILAGEVVAVLVGSRGGYRFASLGPLSLKGLATPVPAVVVEWQATGKGDGAGTPDEVGEASRLPLPGFLTAMGSVFVGREVELEHLRVTWRAAISGGRRLVLVGGEPGVGKTRLAAALAEEVYAGEAFVLSGHCDEHLGVPYQPLVEALNHFVDHTPDSHLVGRLGRFGGELVRLVPELAERAPGLGPPLCSDPETERYRLFDAVAAWLAATSQDAPTLLVLDDLQWAARPTLLLLRHVVRSPTPMRLLAVGTYRDTELGPGHPLAELLADLRRDDGIERLLLSGLDQAGVAAFMEQAAGHGLDDGDLVLARAIHQETEGNPFFVREVLRHLTETGAVERQDGCWATRRPVEEVGIPEGVRDVVGRRISRLSKEANRTLRVAAVVGAEFEVSVLLAAEMLDEEDLLSAVEEATEARLVLEVAGLAGHYQFAHALVRDTLYDGLSAARRVTLHRRVAEAIETVHARRLDGYLPALAYHYRHASTAEVGKAVAYAARAGDRALTQLAHDEAAGYYRQALDLIDVGGAHDDESQRLKLQVSLGEAQKRAGDPAHRETLLQAAVLAQERADADALAQAALANTRGHIPSEFGAVDSERVRTLEYALAAVAEDDSPIRARLLATLALELTFAPDRRRCRQLSDEALAMARRLEDLQTLCHVLLARYIAIMSPDALAECLSNSEELLRVAAALPDPAIKCRAFSLRYRLLMETGDATEADRCFHFADELAVELKQPMLLFVLKHVPRTGRALIAGDLEEAECLAREGREVARATGQVDAEVWFATHMFLIRFEQDRLDEVEGLIAGVVGDNAARRLHLPFLETLLAVVHCELDHEEAAAVALERCGSAAPPVDLFWLVTMVNRATAAAHFGDVGQCQQLYELLWPYRHYAVPYNVYPTPSVAHYLGLLAATVGRFEEAERCFAAADDTHTRIGARMYLARTHLEWAQMLLARHARGDAKRARDLLGQALTTAGELDLANIERRALALLA